MSGGTPGIAGKAAVFLDRDGTINVEKDYLYRIEDFEFIPGAIEAILLLREAGYLVVVVTNQSGIARGYYDETALCQLHRFLDSELAESGAGVDAYYFCPHHPEHGVGTNHRDCSCRKPLPGMLLQAAADLGLDLPSSFMIGDKLVDIQAGIAAGCRPILVRTGYGASQEALLPAGVACCDDLLAAVRLIIAQGRAQAPKAP